MTLSRRVHRSGPPVRGGTKREGQAIVEFALVFPIFWLWLIVSIQLALVVVQYYSLMRVTRETTRWLALRPDTIDTDVLLHARATPLTLTPSQILTATPSPSCPSLTGSPPRCASRLAGDIVSVQINYDMGSWLFLPTNYGIGDLQVTIPSALPPYKVSVMIE